MKSRRTTPEKILVAARAEFVRRVRQAVEKGAIRPVKPMQLFLHFVGLCAVPVLTQPLLHHPLRESEEQRTAFLSEREREVL